MSPKHQHSRPVVDGVHFSNLISGIIHPTRKEEILPGQIGESTSNISDDNLRIEEESKRIIS
jgi:hypothetical protein